MKLLEIIAILKSAPADSEEFKGALEELFEGYCESRFVDNPFIRLGESLRLTANVIKDVAQTLGENLEKSTERIKEIQEFELPEIEEGGSEDDQGRN